MTETETPNALSKAEGPRWGRFALAVTAGIIGGAIAGAVMAEVTSGSAPDWLAGSEVVAIAVATLYVIMGVAMVVALLSPELGNRFLNFEDAEEIREQRSQLATSAGALLLMGLFLVVLAVTGDARMIDKRVGSIILIALVVPLLALTVRSARLSDELMRQLQNEAGTIASYLISVALVGWATLAHLGTVTPPAMLDLVSIVWLAPLIAAFWAAGRRGMLDPR